MKCRVVSLLLALISCQSHTRDASPVETKGQPAAPNVAASESPPSESQLDAAWHKQAEKQLNPNAAPYYSGPLGGISGTIFIRGDAPPPRATSKPIPVGKCFEAHKQLKSLFRVGPKGELADALIAATGYAGQLSPVTTPVRLEASGCAFKSHTVAMMLGQDLLISNRGPEPIAPHLLGNPTPVMRFAVPGGNPTPVRPTQLGHFMLVDRSNDVSSADVYTLAYPTATVSDLSGTFTISGVPAGEVTLSALLPTTGDVVEQKVTVVAGESAQVRLELDFDLKRYHARMQQQAASEAGAGGGATSASGAQKPAPSSSAGKH
jgi:hypothetical protein